jgi:hypothetical protein
MHPLLDRTPVHHSHHGDQTGWPMACSKRHSQLHQ